MTVATGARASCAAPELSVTPGQVSVGDEITIKGQYWNDVCNDTPGTSGCWGGSDDEDQPTQNIELILVNRDTKARYPVGTVDADDDLQFKFTTTIDAPPGWYVVKDGDGSSYPGIGSKFRVVGPGSDGAGG